MSAGKALDLGTGGGGRRAADTDPSGVEDGVMVSEVDRGPGMRSGGGDGAVGLAAKSLAIVATGDMVGSGSAGEAADDSAGESGERGEPWSPPDALIVVDGERWRRRESLASEGGVSK